MSISVIGIGWGWFIEAWRSSNGWVGETNSCSLPDDEGRVDPTGFVGNPLLNRQELFVGFHAGTLQKVQRNFCPVARAIERT